MIPAGEGSGAPASSWPRPGARRPDEPDGDEILLRAQMALAAGIGIAVLRSSIQLQPLSSATEQDLVGPLRDLVDALLPPR